MTERGLNAEFSNVQHSPFGFYTHVLQTVYFNMIQAQNTMTGAKEIRRGYTHIRVSLRLHCFAAWLK